MATYSIPLTRSLNKQFVHRNFITVIVGLLSILIFLIIVIFYVLYKGSSYSDNNLHGYEHCPQPKDGKINIHVLAHTHDDVAWLKTFDQYYYGTNSQIHNAGVQYILDSVVDQLLHDENRRFVYVEIAFFWRWWNEQTPEKQALVKMLVDRGQLEFAGGAWSMNDEATTSYESIIDNFSWGFRKLTEMFGDSVMARPKIGWQIDPFGHSREQASIFAQLGFDGAFLNRIDYQDKALRMKSKNAEFIWKGSPNLGKSSNIFCTILYNHYSPINGFHFGYHRENDAIVDDPENPEYNIDRKVSVLLNEINLRSKLYNTTNVYITWGDDFTYQNAGVWFKNIDKIIRNINKHFEELNIFYSTPGCYVKAVNNDKNLLLSTKEDDFFPYVQSGYSYWTGYYTTRPTLKYLVRFASNFLQICKQLMVIANVDENYNNGALDEFRSTIAMMQHHDAMTGTSKTHVIKDYKLRIAKSIQSCEVVLDHAIKKLLSNGNTDKTADEKKSFRFTSCLHTNITECATSESGQPFILTLYNPLSRPATHFVRLPVRGDGLVSYEVLNSQSEQEMVQLIPVPEPVKKMPGRKSNSTFEIVFKADNIPPLGFRSYYITPSNDPKLVYSSREMPFANLYTIGDINKTAITIDGETNLVKSVFFDGKMNSLEQSYMYYASKEHPERGKPSGAYIFNPYNNEPKPISELKPEIKVFTGVHVDEIHQKFNDWASQIIRIYKNENHVEFEWLVGPLNVSKDLIGKEVIIRYKMPQLISNESFYTDCNGREMIRRIRNKRRTWSVTMGNSTVSGNYYPITSRIMIRDSEKQLSVMPDRPEGGTSLHEGEIELMVHRESLFDDELGVGEPLIENEFNEEIQVRGKHYLTTGSVNKQNAYDRLLIERKQNHVWMFFTQMNNTTFSTWNDIFKTENSGLKPSLPNNVKILTLEPWLDGEILLRLEHFIEKSDHIELSKMAVVDIENLFVPFTIRTVKEMTLGASIKLEKRRRLKWLMYPSASSGNESDYVSDVEKPMNNQEINWKQIILYPMQIRTFIISVTFQE